MHSISSLLRIPNLKIEKVQQKDCMHVWGKPKKKPACMHCQKDTLRIKATYKRTLKHTRCGNQLMLLHLSIPKYHCLHCHRYFRYRFQGIRPRFRATESYRLEVFEAHDGGVSQRKLSQTHQISHSTVERWYKSYIQQRISEIKCLECPSILGIDEHFFTRKKGYATTFVDLKKHRVFDVVLGRSERSLSQYLKALKGKEKVKVIVMDLSDTYRSIARKHFPNAMIVSDRFHVVRLANHHLLKLWKSQDPEGRKNRGLISLMRRHHWNLKPEQKILLKNYLSKYPILDALYEAKQKLVHFLLLKNLSLRKAKAKLTQFLSLLEQFKASPAKALYKTISSWLEPIVRMWRFSKSNGITEGFHTKMEMISRRAYGFRSFENYRLRVLAQCGWNGIINRI